MRGSEIDFDFWPDYCERIFGSQMPENHTNATNAHYGGLDIPGDNIVFINAAEDPWQMAGMTQIHNPETQSTMTALFVDCADCGHCIDFHTPEESQPEALTQVQDEIETIVTKWVRDA